MSNEFRKSIKNISIQPLKPWISGRFHTEQRKIRLGDVGPDGRIRLDALTRYAQDVSDDDTTAAGLDDGRTWVVRRTEVDVLSQGVLAEEITITTFCSAVGRRWAERRLTMRGSNGAHYEVATLWICVDSESGKPATLSDQFWEIYGSAAGQRKVSAKLTHPKTPEGIDIETWSLRLVDFDIFGHVNNAAYWAVVEEILERHPTTVPYRAAIEYSTGVERGSSIAVANTFDGEGHFIWWLGDGLVPAASASIIQLTDGFYHGEHPHS